MSDTATIVQLPWLAVFDQDIPARVLSAVSYGNGFVILSDARDRPEDRSMLSAVVSRLQGSGVIHTTLTAPLAQLAVLEDAISDAMAPTIASGRPLVVIIRQAEALSSATIRRLVDLAAIRQGGQPVLRFLLAGTSGLWPVLRHSGLGHLEDDPAAHIRLNQAELPPELQPLPAAFTSTAPGAPDFLAQPHPRPATPQPPGPASADSRMREEPGGQGAILVRLGVLGLGLVGIGVAGWFILAAGAGPGGSGSGTPEQLASTAGRTVAMSPDARFAALVDREKSEIAADRLSSPPGDNLLETRRQIDRLLPLVSSQVLHSLTKPSAGADADQAAHPADRPGLPKPLPVTREAGGAAAAPIDDVMHVTLRYSRGDKAAEARARRLLTLLRSRGILSDGPEPSGAAIGRSSLDYYFDQDRTAALDLARQLPSGTLSDIPRTRTPMTTRGSSDASSLPRPGEVSISIGSRDDLGEVAPPAGKQT